MCLFGRLWNLAERSLQRAASMFRNSGGVTGEGSISPEQTVVDGGEGTVASPVSGAGCSVGQNNREFQDEASDAGILESPLEKSFGVGEGPNLLEQTAVAENEGAVTPPVPGIGSGVRRGHRAFQDNALDERIFEKPLEDDDLPAGEYAEQILAEPHKFTTRVKPVGISLRSPTPTSVCERIRKRASKFSLRLIRILTNDRASRLANAKRRGVWPSKEKTPRYREILWTN